MVVMATQDEILDQLSWAVDAMDVSWWRDAGWAVADEQVLAAASAAQVLIDEGQAGEAPAGTLAEALSAWRAQPEAFDATLGSLAKRADTAMALSGWVEDEAGRPMPVPPHHWWWRLSKDW